MPVLSAVLAPCDGPSTSFEEPETCSSLPWAVSPTRANCTRDLPDILPLLSICNTFTCALAPRWTTTLPSLVTGETTVAVSISPTVALSELKSLSRRTTTGVPAAIADEELTCWELPAPFPWLTPVTLPESPFCTAALFCPSGAGGVGFCPFCPVCP